MGYSHRNPEHRWKMVVPSHAFLLPFVSPVRSSTRHDEHGHPTGFGGEAEVLPNRTRTDPSQGQRRSHHQRTHTCRTDTRSRSGHGEKHTCEQIPTVTKRKEKKERETVASSLSHHGMPKQTCEGRERPKAKTNVRRVRTKGGTTAEPRRRSKQPTRKKEPTTHASARKKSERNVNR